MYILCTRMSWSFSILKIYLVFLPGSVEAGPVHIRDALCIHLEWLLAAHQESEFGWLGFIKAVKCMWSVPIGLKNLYLDIKQTVTLFWCILVRRKALCKLSQKSQGGCSQKKLLPCSHNGRSFTLITSYHCKESCMRTDTPEWRHS